MIFARIKHSFQIRWGRCKRNHIIGSYSQNYEDFFFLNILYNNIKLPIPAKLFYLDIGANHPKTLNNTWLLYKRGAHGIIVEPNPDMISLHEACRPRDKQLAVGLSSTGGGVLPYYCFTSPTLNTFSEEERDSVLATGTSLKETKNIQVLSVIDFEKKYVADKEVHFMSLDVEGLDFQILKAWDFTICKPYIICVETQEYYGGKEEGFLEIVRYMNDYGYSIYGDTGLNTFFVRVDKIKKFEDYQV